jgi:hypothetical protein
MAKASSVASSSKSGVNKLYHRAVLKDAQVHHNDCSVNLDVPSPGGRFLWGKHLRKALCQDRVSRDWRLAVCVIMSTFGARFFGESSSSQRV